MILLYYVYFHFEHFYYNLVYFYANKVDNPNAQHAMAHRILKSEGNVSEALKLFRKSEKNPHSAYNLVAAHLSGYQTDLQEGKQ